jgi:hypothetical protein
VRRAPERLGADVFVGEELLARVEAHEVEATLVLPRDAVERLHQRLGGRRHSRRVFRATWSHLLHEVRPERGPESVQGLYKASRVACGQRSNEAAIRAQDRIQ